MHQGKEKSSERFVLTMIHTLLSGRHMGRTILCVWLLICLCLTACGNDRSVSGTEPELRQTIPQPATEAPRETEPEETKPQTTEPEATEAEATEAEEESDSITIETAVCSLSFSRENARHLQHVEVIQDDRILEVFYAKQEDTQMEVFRILFSAGESDRDIGVIAAENGNLYISVTVSDTDSVEFQNEAMEESYYAILTELNRVLESIQTDCRFQEKQDLEILHAQHSFAYWNLSLPEQMTWEETWENGYSVTFCANINGEQIKLYSVSIGGEPLGSMQGYYWVEGQWLPVTMEAYGLPSVQDWEESAVTELYTMMSTINDVMQAVMSSENFSEEIPG